VFRPDTFLQIFLSSSSYPTSPFPRLVTFCEFRLFRGLCSTSRTSRPLFFPHKGPPFSSNVDGPWTPFRPSCLFFPPPVLRPNEDLVGGGKGCSPSFRDRAFWTEGCRPYFPLLFFLKPIFPASPTCICCLVLFFPFGSEINLTSELFSTPIALFFPLEQSTLYTARPSPPPPPLLLWRLVLLAVIFSPKESYGILRGRLPYLSSLFFFSDGQVVFSKATCAFAGPQTQ